jgi:hypothetical protein
MAPSNSSSTAKTSIPIDSTWKSRVLICILLSRPTPSVLQLPQHLLQLVLVSPPVWDSKALRLGSLPLANPQLKHLRSAKPLPSVSPHNLVSVRLLPLVAEVQRLDNPRIQHKTLDLARHPL